MLHTLIARFRKNTLQNTLLLSVILFHFIFLIMVLFLSPASFKKKEHKHLFVRTVVSQPQPKVAAVQKVPQRPHSTPKAAPTSAPAPKKRPDAAKPEIKKQIAPAPTPQKKPAIAKEPAIADKKLTPVKQQTPSPQKTSPPPPRAKISDSLLKELEESIAKIENKSDKTAVSKKMSTPSPATAPMTLQIDINPESNTESNSMQESYTDTLIGYLHQSLSLPDYGEVKIQLSLRQDGTVAKVIVLKAKNEKNRQYLESNLPRLLFPRFDGAWASKKEHTFVLTFCNEQ